jgi:hypothetical protein
MPLGFERLNERTKRPNNLINFIRPLPGSQESMSQDFLERIAAIVYPIMKANHIAVMALEEFPPNREFWGRNFNAGEVIQLVLKAPGGQWLPFRHVQMVMLHELAHCKEMNHSRNFWKVRNGYADELRALWGKKYTGEGLWGNGRGLGVGAYLSNHAMPDAELLPESLCGGTYRNRGKRKRGGKTAGKTAGKPHVSYAERKQRRIMKKFGAGGAVLGADEEERRKLENGKQVKGKPRVAGSARARELRAAAALARFDKAKAEPKAETLATGDEDSETESDCSWDESDEMLSSGGKDLVRVCENEDEDDENVKREKEEMMESFGPRTTPTTVMASVVKSEPWASKNCSKIPPICLSTSKDPTTTKATTPTSLPRPAHDPKTPSLALPLKPSATHGETKRLIASSPEAKPCPACSFTNDVSAITCIVCSNVLNPKTTRNHWRCTKTCCKASNYVNSGDYGQCQICGSKR